MNSPADEFDATWIGDGRALLFARSEQVDKQPIRLWLAHCDGHAYANAQAWANPLNRSDGYTLGPSLDPGDAASLLVTALQQTDGKASLDIVRVAMPSTRGRTGCAERVPQRSRSQAAAASAK